MNFKFNIGDHVQHVVDDSPVPTPGVIVARTEYASVREYFVRWKPGWLSRPGLVQYAEMELAPYVNRTARQSETAGTEPGDRRE